MIETYEWHRVRVITHTGSTLAVVPDPEPEPHGTDVRIGWSPTSVPLTLVPAPLRMPNSVFWIASDRDREPVAVSSEPHGRPTR